MTKITTHDAYFLTAPEQFRPMLAHLRLQLALALPDANEVIAYNMAGFKIGKAIVVGYAAFTKQCGIYVSHAAIDQLRVDIEQAGFKATKMGVTFSDKKPLPDNLIAALALASRKGYGV